MLIGILLCHRDKNYLNSKNELLITTSHKKNAQKYINFLFKLGNSVIRITIKHRNCNTSSKKDHLIWSEKKINDAKNKEKRFVL